MNVMSKTIERKCNMYVGHLAVKYWHPQVKRANFNFPHTIDRTSGLINIHMIRYAGIIVFPRSSHDLVVTVNNNNDAR